MFAVWDCVWDGKMPDATDVREHLLHLQNKLYVPSSGYLCICQLLSAQTNCTTKRSCRIPAPYYQHFSCQLHILLVERLCVCKQLIFTLTIWVCYNLPPWENYLLLSMTHQPVKMLHIKFSHIRVSTRRKQLVFVLRVSNFKYGLKIDYYLTYKLLDNINSRYCKARSKIVYVIRHYEINGCFWVEVAWRPVEQFRQRTSTPLPLYLQKVVPTKTMVSFGTTCAPDASLILPSRPGRHRQLPALLAAPGPLVLSPSTLCLYLYSHYFLTNHVFGRWFSVFNF